jgi:hypothetical protein
VIGVPHAAPDIRAHEPASADQRQELRELIGGRALDQAWRRRFFDKVRAAGDLTRSAADEALFYARSCAPAGPPPRHAIGEQVDALRHLVSTRVVPGPLGAVFRRRAESLELTYVEADRWIREWLRLPLRPFVLAADLTRMSGWSAPDGYFALMRTDGYPRCYRIHTLAADGKRVVEQITGDLRTQRRRIVGYQAIEVLQAVAADPAAARVLFARTRGRCSVCNQPIDDTTKPGYGHGYGPDCWDNRPPGTEGGTW